MIQIRNGFYSVDGFNLAMDIAIRKNCITAVLGPSGGGKTTLLNVISGFEPLQTGNVFIDNIDNSNTSPAARPISCVFQDNNCFAHLSARDNVALGVLPNLRLSEDDWQRVDNALARVGLESLAQRLPGDMSGGERQRIALARVLVRNKPILLLDEAFAALSPSLRREMISLVQELQREKELTVLMVTHQPEDARLIAQEVIFVDLGVVRQPVALKKFFAGKDKDVLRYLGSPA